MEINLKGCQLFIYQDQNVRLFRNISDLFWIGGTVAPRPPLISTTDCEDVSKYFDGWQTVFVFDNGKIFDDVNCLNDTPYC